MPPAKLNKDSKYDIQLGQAGKDEARLAQILSEKKIELKTESFLWERTGNFAVEIASRGKRSGLAATEADYWAHELIKDGQTLCYLLFPVERLKQICRDIGEKQERAGDDDAQTLFLISLRKLFG